MQTVDPMQFLVTLTLTVLCTGLLSRVYFFLTRRWSFSFEKLAVIHAASVVMSWLLFVGWCSTATKIYWFSGHVVVMPQIGWFIFDIVNSTGERSAFEEASKAEPNRDT